MNRLLVLSVTGRLLMVVAAFLLAPLGLAIFENDLREVFSYGSSATITGLSGLLLYLVGRRAPSAEMHRKDAFGIVALTWFALGLFGGLPFWIDGSIPLPASAIFEAVSGFTTTGATVVPDPDSLSRAANLWRTMMHWIGGMGIVVLFVAVFPQLGVGAKQLFRTEVPGPSSEGLQPRIKQTALTLWWLYTALTVICAAGLVALGMPLYDAIVHAFSTLGTGGFSNRTLSIGYYQNPAIEWFIALFMLIAGLNFGLYYGAARGRWRELWTNSELRFFLTINVVVILVVAVSILARHDGPLEALRYATFQTLSVTTTTGFITEDFDTYPEIARYLLFVVMFMGGSAGSTAGGLKAIRVLLLIRLSLRELLNTVQPQAVITLRLGRRPVSNPILTSVLVFTAAFVLIFVVGTGLMVALGLDLVSASSATIACLSNIGPGLSKVGPGQNFSQIPELGKMILSFIMIAGRLEIFALLAVFTPECWRR